MKQGRLVFVVSAIVCAAHAPAQMANSQQLAPTGTLRVTYLKDNAVQGRIDAKTGAVTGPVADITKELARWLGVPYQITPGAGVRAVLDSVKMHMADLGFLAYDATR